MKPDEIERLAQRMVELWWAEHDKRERAKADAYERALGNWKLTSQPRFTNAIGGQPTTPPRGVR